MFSKMATELIPVIDIQYCNQNIPLPQNGPYWKYTRDWDEYNAACYLKAGFKDKLAPYLPGSSFYKLTDITNDNLVKITKDYTQGVLSGKYTRDQASQLSGGYVLKIDGLDVYFPQCCGDLSDINYWENILSDNKSHYYAGHPDPGLTITEYFIEFDFEINEFDEQFVPPPIFNKVQVNKKELNIAVDEAKIELTHFADRVNEINITQQLHIRDIDKLLIWGED